MLEIEDVLFALIVLLITLPFLIWVIFNRWQVWTRLLEGQLARLAQEVEKLQRKEQSSGETIRELRENIERVNQVVNIRHRSPRFLTLQESSDMATLANIMREMVKTIRKSLEPGSSVARYLETRRKTIASLLDRMVGT
jgi:hypothetical protein